MTRTEKYKELRALIDSENAYYKWKCPEIYDYLITNQKEIKQRLGCKH